MKRLTIGILDYGVGNLTSISSALQALGYRTRISADEKILAQVDMLLLPGVGTFPHAMNKLNTYGLSEFIKNQAKFGKPVVGICLGMQLLADSSTELEYTDGLRLIPGKVLELSEPSWHIGWNTIDLIRADSLLQDCDGESVYFNHSYVFRAHSKYQLGVTRFNSESESIPIVVRNKNVVGLQFHPEKSQRVGRSILAGVIEGLCNA